MPLRIIRRLTQPLFGVAFCGGQRLPRTGIIAHQLLRDPHRPVFSHQRFGIVFQHLVFQAFGESQRFSVTALQKPRLRKRDAKMPDVPTLFELMDKEKTPARSRLLANVMLDAGGFGPYPIVAAPGVPAERVKILREAYGLTLKTPEFLEEAKKNKWEIKPVGGDDLDALAKEVANPSTEVIERLKLLLGD